MLETSPLLFEFDINQWHVFKCFNVHNSPDVSPSNPATSGPLSLRLISRCPFQMSLQMYFSIALALQVMAKILYRYYCGQFKA